MSEVKQGSHQSWLINCPASDGNFKSHLKEASVTDLKAALTAVKGVSGSKTKIKVLEAEIKRRGKKNV